jgi:glutamate--cysteine ligase catalytic subunit
LQEFFNCYSLGLTSFATPIILGTEDHILIEDPDVMEDVQRHQGQLEKRNRYSQSLFAIDSTENPHPRFSGLMQSIRERRGEKVQILVPIYKDENTSLKPSREEPEPGFIYMDSMHFGMGCSCLQVTYETQTINHARYLHDQLLAFTPILAALSANSVIFKGKLGNIDMRWRVISESVDCRTQQERNPEHPDYIPKSRYSTINHYLSNHEYVKDKYNDTVQYRASQEHMELL